MSNHDEIKYKLNQISIIQDGHISGWVKKQESFNIRSTNNQKLNDRERNPIMTACAGVIPILLAIFSLEYINLETLLNYLLVDITLIFGFFVFYGIYNYKNSVTFAKIESILLENSEKMETLKAHIDDSAFDLNQFDNNKLQVIYIITKLTQGASNLRYRNSLQDAINSKTFHNPTKKEFKSIVDSGQDLIKENIEYYNTVKEIVKSKEWNSFTYLYEDLKKESELISK